MGPNRRRFEVLARMNRRARVGGLGLVLALAACGDVGDPLGDADAVPDSVQADAGGDGADDGGDGDAGGGDGGDGDAAHDHESHSHGGTDAGDAGDGSGEGDAAHDHDSHSHGGTDTWLDAEPDGSGAPTDWVWDSPAGLPPPRVPEGNPMSVAKVELGRWLFYDTRLSLNETQSCGSCHEQALAFTDGRARGLGSTGEEHPRSSMSLVNIAYVPRLTWANPNLRTLEQQALLPLFGEAPVELGMSGREDTLLARIRGDAAYVARFADAFPERAVGGADPITVASIADAIAAFQRSILSANSPYDQYRAGDRSALSDAERRGMDLFFSEQLECFHCHGGPLFADSLDHTRLPVAEVAFHNTGLYNLDGAGAYPDNNRGVMDVSERPEDMGRFRAPTLRNIAVTAPYFHDGSALTLDDVIDHYAAGGRTIAEGPYAGVGATSPLKSESLIGFELTDTQRADLIAFLNSLTDQDVLTNPRWSNPHAAP